MFQGNGYRRHDENTWKELNWYVKIDSEKATVAIMVKTLQSIVMMRDIVPPYKYSSSAVPMPSAPRAMRGYIDHSRPPWHSS